MPTNPRNKRKSKPVKIRPPEEIDVPVAKGKPRPKTSSTLSRNSKSGNKVKPVTLAGGDIVFREPRRFKMGGGETCNAKKASGHRCNLAAGWGTPHPGIGKCKWHGGLAPTHLRKAAKEEMNHLLGFEMEMDPFDALMWCVRITAGEVHWLSIKLSQTPERQWFQETIMGRQLNMWAQQRITAVERLAKYSKWAIDAGIAERQVRLAEFYGETIARLLQGIFEDLRLSPEQREWAPSIVAKHLNLIEKRSIHNDPNPLVSGVDPDTIEIPAETVIEVESAPPLADFSPKNLQKAEKEVQEIQSTQNRRKKAADIKKSPRKLKKAREEDLVV